MFIPLLLRITQTAAKTTAKYYLLHKRWIYTMIYMKYTMKS